MPQLSLIAMSNLKAIQDENCHLGSEGGESGTNFETGANAIAFKKKQRGKEKFLLLVYLGDNHNFIQHYTSAGKDIVRLQGIM